MDSGGSGRPCSQSYLDIYPGNERVGLIMLTRKEFMEELVHPFFSALLLGTIVLVYALIGLEWLHKLFNQ